MTISKMTLAASLFAATLAITSCGDSNNTADAKTATTTADKKNDDKKPQDEELKGFMLGGIYFVDGWGGKSAVDTQVEAGGTESDDVIKSYRQLFIFPFETSDAAGAKNTLVQWWDVNNKEQLLKTLDELKNHKMQSGTHKAWDYARLVNNVCVGYAAGYLTKEEGKKWVDETLVLAKADYKNWDSYYTDFAAGRKAWNSTENADAKRFATLSAEITKGDNNIYQLLPLN